ncbi:hypothetical protein KI387_024591, partial [Taxus chinensis]
WWKSDSVVVVTGANKGIGFEIVRQLAQNGLTVVLTARDVNRGLSAVKTLKDEGLNVVFRQLDIHNPHSISEFAEWLKDNYGGLDMLVNNAGVFGVTIDHETAFRAILNKKGDHHIYEDVDFGKAFKTNYEMSKECIEINYYGTKRMIETLLPLIRSEGRIVNVSSDGGLLRYLKNETFLRPLTDVSSITEEVIDQMIDTFLEDMKSGQIEGKGWPIFCPPYGVSKFALNAYSRLLAKKLSEEGKKICVSNVHPGSVKTDMSGQAGDLTAPEGADNVVTVALLPPGGPSGQFYFLKEPHSFV